MTVFTGIGVNLETSCAAPLIPVLAKVRIGLLAATTITAKTNNASV